MGGAPARVVLLCASALLVNGYAIVSISIAVPALAAAWNLSAPAFGGVFVAGSAGMVAGAIVAGPIGGRLGHGPALVASLAVLAGGTLACGFTAGVGGLLVGRCLTGIGIGGIIPLACALTAEAVPERRRAAIVMAICVCDPAGGFLGSQLAARLASDFDWRMIFWLGGLPPLVLIPALLVWLPELPRIPAGTHPPRGLFRDRIAPATAAVWIFYFAIYLGLTMVSFWLPAVLARSGETAAVSGRAANLINAATIAGALVLVSFCWRFGARPVLAVVLPAGAAAIAAVSLMHLNRDPLLLAVCLIRLCIIGATTGGNGMTAALYPAGLRATGIGCALASGRLGVIAGPYVGSTLLLAGWQPSRILLCAGLCVLIGAACVVILRVIERRRAVRPA